jgi:hypothetical protein
MYRRVAEAVAAAELAFGATDSERQAVAEVFYGLMASGAFLPNSPTLMNAGRERGMLSACFVLPVHDDWPSITAVAKKTEDSVEVLSCPDAIARALEEALGSAGRPAETAAAGTCPDCGHALRRGSGCAVCGSCGYTRCG